jgi:hypothetical protein
VVGLSAYSVPGPGFDFYAYWSVDPQSPYEVFTGFGAFRYAPPLIWLAGPLRLLPFETAYWMWAALLFAVLVALTGRWALAWLAFPPVTSELFHGNVHLLLAAALVWGFRWPALWAFLPLAKVTTALPLLYPMLRRDARLIGTVIALAAVCLVSLIVSPSAWPAWLERLSEPSGARLVDGGGAQIAIPLALRLPVAAVITIWAAWSRRRWPLAVALALSLPQLWVHGLAILAAIPRLRRLDPGLDRSGD